MTSTQHGKKLLRRAWRLSLASGSWWAFSALLALACCAPQPVAITVGRVVVDAPRSFDARTSERDLLRAGVIERLAQSSGIKYVNDTHDATHVLRVGVGEAFSMDGAPPLVPIEVTLKATGDASEFSAAATVAQGASLPATWLAGFDDAWPALQAMRKLDVAKTQTLLTALHDNDVRLREFAIQRLGERRTKAAVEPLCKLLAQEKDGNLLYKAIGALVAIGDPRAVEPLIALSHQKDPAFVLQVVFAVGAIGGRTAQAYLVTLASGHPDEEIQRGAKDALDELSRRSLASKH